MLEDFRLKVFAAVARQNSFTRAAEDLGISQPAVSQHISELEKQLNVKLFERLHGKTLLTDAGQIFGKYAEQIISDYHQVNMMFQEHPKTPVHVYASEEVYDYLIGNILADFIICHPEITFTPVSEPDSADIVMELMPDETEKGKFVLNALPSETFATTDLWTILHYHL